jgi:hypothetical protein
VLQQSWLAKPEPGFEPGTVRAGWHNDSLVLLAELKDTDIYTHARYPNERLWELGDTLEIFLRPLGQAAYNEFQVAPNNLRAQLRFANAAALLSARKHDAFEDVLVPGDHFSTRTWVQPDMGQWYVLLEIPVRTVGDQPHSLKGSEWLFSFCRCDYTRGRPAPVLSSTSVHAQPDFHRQVEWGTLRFECSRKVNRCDFIKKGIGAREDATR